MWSPTSLRITNLFSYEDSLFEFINNQTTMVYGVNKTDENVHSNRSGKTSILDVITIGFIGEPLRDIKKAEIVRNGQKEGILDFTLNNPVLGEEMRILRTIHSTKSNNALVYINNEPVDRLKDLAPAETDKLILEKLGISKEDLINYYLISKDSYTSFFSNGDVGKKEIINRFSKADLVDNVNPHIDEDIKVIDEQLNTLNTQLTANKTLLTHLDGELVSESLSSSIEQTRQLIINTLTTEKESLEIKFNAIPTQIDAVNDTVSDAVNKISTLNETIATITGNINIYEAKITDLTNELTTIRQSESTIETEYQPKFKAIDDEIKSCNDEIIEYNAAIKESDTIVAKYEKQLAGTINCPKCEHKFSLQDKEFNHVTISELLAAEKEVIAGVNELIKDVQFNIASLEAEKEQLKSQLQSKLKSFVEQKFVINKRIGELNTSLSVEQTNKKTKDKELNDNNDQIDALKREIVSLTLESESLEKQIIDKKTSIETETNKVYPNKTAELKDKILAITTQNDTLLAELEVWQKDKNDLVEWQVRFKQFKSFLANTSIGTIQDMINFFLSKMKTNLSVMINGYRELANKKLKEEIETLISRDGLNGERINKFSGEEKCEVNLAAILSFQKIINMASPSGGLNLIFIDEILESADSLALSNIIKSLTLLEQTIFLITHVSPDTIFECNSLVVEKINNISQIKQNA